MEVPGKKLVAGVYRLYDPKGGGSYVGVSRNLNGTMKRLRFELTLNACPYKPLQAFWNACGKLDFEVLEEYAPGNMSELEFDAHLRAKQMLWEEKLGPQTHGIQSEVTF